MSDRDFLTLDPELSALLDAERPIPSAVVGARTRVYARVAASVGLPPALSPPVAPVTAAPDAPVSASPTPATSPHLRLALTTLVGALAGGGLIYLLMQPAPVSAPAPLPVALVAPEVQGPPLPSAPPAAPSSTPVPAQAIATLPSPHPHHKLARAHAAAESFEESGLSAERALLDRARSSLALGDVKAATLSLRAHERRFPDGQLAEERESLAIRALVAAGRGAEARARGVAFEARFPTSMHRPAVDATLQSIP